MVSSTGGLTPLCEPSQVNLNFISSKEGSISKKYSEIESDIHKIQVGSEPAVQDTPSHVKEILCGNDRNINDRKIQHNKTTRNSALDQIGHKLGSNLVEHATNPPGRTVSDKRPRA